MGSMHGGHYTADCKSPANGAWYNFNDSSVSPTDPQAIGGAAAYICFFRRVA
jgi:ubiquitin carboxyl-terminal hydrolase 4/11/15